MSRTLRLALCTVGLLLPACKETNSEYCDGHPDDQTNCPAPDAGLCTTNDECPGAVCDTTSGTCVECTTAQPSACTDTTPVCSADNTCTACTAHDQCAASDVCLPSGACADETQVAYVAASGTGTACTKAAPCPLLASAVAKNLPLIKIAASGAAKASAPVVIDGKAVTILAAPGATLSRDGLGPILEIKSAAADVKIVDLQISGATGTSDAAILLTSNGGMPKLALTRVKVTGNQGLGISANGGSLSVSQSTISSNTGGGISISNASYNVVSNFFFANGSATGSVGGIVILTSMAPTNRLEFNSFNKNQAQDGLGAAVQCVAGTFTARSNIMSGNGTLSSPAQIGGTCTHTHSISQPGPLPPGTGNTAVDPMFINTTTGDLHIAASSPARGMADTASELSGVAAFDIDGNPRANPADIGADEVP